MKTKNLFKRTLTSGITVLSTSALIALTAAQSYATAANPSTSGSAQSQVGSQLSLTHDAIGQLLDRMQHSKNDPGLLDQADYQAKSQKFQTTIAQATQDFEAYLSDPHEGILIQAQGLMAKYNEIYESSQYSDEVKKTLLGSQKTYLDSFSRSIANSYALAVLKLMKAGGINVEYLVARQIFRNLSGETITPVIAADCYSQSCINNSAFDQVTYISLIESLFLNPIHFTLEDGAKLDITPDRGLTSEYLLAIGYELACTESNSCRKDTAESIKSALPDVIAIISSTQSLPDNYQSLPVGISADGLKKIFDDQAQAAEQAKEKQQLIDSLTAARAKAVADLTAAVAALKSDASDAVKLDPAFTAVCTPRSSHPELNLVGCVTVDELAHIYQTPEALHLSDKKFNTRNDRIKAEADKVAANFTK